MIHSRITRCFSEFLNAQSICNTTFLQTGALEFQKKNQAQPFMLFFLPFFQMPHFKQKDCRNDNGSNDQNTGTIL